METGAVQWRRRESNELSVSSSLSEKHVRQTGRRSTSRSSVCHGPSLKLSRVTMATGEQRVGLKRKLTGPPRLLLGKTRTRTVGGLRLGSRTNKDKPVGGNSCSELTETAIIDEDLKITSSSSSRRGEGDDITNRKATRRRWWRRFSPIWNRKPQKGDHESDAVLQEAALESDPEKEVVGGRSFSVRAWPPFRRFLTSSGGRRTHKTVEDETFQKKLQRFFIKGGKSRSSGIAPENMVDEKNKEGPTSTGGETPKVQRQLTGTSPEVVMVMAEMSDGQQAAAESEEVKDTGGSEIIQSDIPEGLVDSNVPAEDLAEVPESLMDSNTPAEYLTEVPEGLMDTHTPSKDLTEVPEGLMDSNLPVVDLTKVPEILKDSNVPSEGLPEVPESLMDSNTPAEYLPEVPEGLMDSNVLAKDLPEVPEGLMDSNVLAKDLPEVPEGLMNCNAPAEGLPESPEGLMGSNMALVQLLVSEVLCVDEPTSQTLQSSTNGPSIRIELVPPEDEDEEEDCSSSQTKNLLFLLLGLDQGEQQLVQTARSLVRAAMKAAVDQLTREQLSDTDCVLRELPGCRDHA